MAETENKNTPPANAAPPAASTEGESLDMPGPDNKGSSSGTGVGQPKQTPTKGDKGSGGRSFNIYFIFFIVVILAAIGSIIFAVKSAQNSSKDNAKKTASLTSQQISTLKGNTTLVGDSKTTLDIQSNAIFEGEVLVRSDLSIAGGLKLGKSLSINDLSVNGTGTFGNLNVSGTSTVTGNAAVQGALSVQKGLTVNGGASFGNLNVGQLSVTTLQLAGDLSVNRHIVTSGGNPSRTPGTALGGGGTVSVSGSDTAGTVTVSTGNSPAAGLFVTVNFNQRFGSTPHVIITPIGFAAGSINYYVNRDTGSFSIGCASPPPAGASFAFDYFVVN
jgi:cytoskeletal protein CcmA (bactofilin family)